MLGVALGEYFVGRCTSTEAVPQQFPTRTFNAGIVDDTPATEFNPFSADQQLDETPTAGKVYSKVPGSNNLPPSALMAQVWGMDQADWAKRFP